MHTSAIPHPPLRLAAPGPGWTVDADAVIAGSGVAGLSAALGLARRAPQARIVLVTKDLLATGSTRWAQGGVAAALAPGDTPVAHMVDTVEAGAGQCDPLAVHVLAEEGPGALRRLIGVGAAFDTGAGGDLELTREGGHRADRIAHAGGDATGAEIERALVAAVRAEPRIEVIEHALALDALPAPGAGAGPGPVGGVTLHVMGEGERDGVGAVRAPAVLLATGGSGQVFATTTNPEVSTGDGTALALRAGARLADMEFIQFHPTVLWLGPGRSGRQPLVSEAVRGEGAVLTDLRGNRIMTGVHELGDLAPRDVVASAIAAAMAGGDDHVLLDARHFGAQKWERRFPTILATCREHGIDPVTEPIPVAPAAHYASGGVAVDVWGRTGVPGLYAVGEAARTGVHGANRLASNSLLEGLVFAERAAEAVAEQLAGGAAAATAAGTGHAAACAAASSDGASGSTADIAGPGLFDPAAVPELQTVMARHAGVRRDGAGLAGAQRRLAELASGAAGAVPPGVAAWEATNLLTVAACILAAARTREESRGAHRRADHPEPRPELRRTTVTAALGAAGLDIARERPSATVPPRLAAALEAIAGVPYGTAPEAARPAAAAAGDGPAARTDLYAGPAAEHAATVLRALAEDLAPETLSAAASPAAPPPGAPHTLADVTTAATVPASQLATADVVARRSGTVAGLPVAELVFWLVAEGAVQIEAHAADGDRVAAGDVLLTVTGRTRDLLTAERTALNALTHLSGIATATAAWTDALAGTRARVRDSRKTHAGLRSLEKYAVRCGGGGNHRFGLGDAALIKDNHVIAAGGVEEAVHAVRRAFPGVPLEVEVDRIDQIEPALKAGAEEILLDNFTPAELREAVALVAGRARLESSGTLTLETAADVAATGVDYLAVGALTHSSPALDIAVDLRPTG